MTELSPRPRPRPEPQAPASLRFADWCHDIAQRPDVHQERYWPVFVSVMIAIAIQLYIPSFLDVVPLSILPLLEGLLLAALVGGHYFHPSREHPAMMQRLRQGGIVLTAIVTADNLASLGLLARELLRGVSTEGAPLIKAAICIWTTNVIIFALWFWQLDGGGPIPRRLRPDGARDFLFPQIQLMQDEEEQLSRDEQMQELGEKPAPYAPKYIGWLPDFVDYLYLAFTNSTAFSPTDTMPLTRRAKLLMMVQSAAALLTLALLAARAVNILHQG